MGVVRVQGADAVKFLQGQVSNDVSRLSAEVSVLAGLHNPQGRAIALLRFVLAGPEEILGVLPRELASGVAARLAKFVLRAKAKVSDASADWEVAGIETLGIAEGQAAAAIGSARRDEKGRLLICVGAGAANRWLALAATSALASSSTLAPTAALADGSPPKTEPDAIATLDSLNVGSAAPAMTREEWRGLDIAAGVPQVYASTTEAFVAQMLNLDVVDGIAFDKGCYTGQEVIARAHYRGKVKRRMQRFRTLTPAQLRAGDSGTLHDGRSFRVVDAVQLGDGRCEFLAVAPTAGGEADDAPGATPSAQPAVLAEEQLTLPYSLPS
jgi:hypothetical protein